MFGPAVNLLQFDGAPLANRLNLNLGLHLFHREFVAQRVGVHRFELCQGQIPPLLDGRFLDPQPLILPFVIEFERLLPQGQILARRLDRILLEIMLEPCSQRFPHLLQAPPLLLPADGAAFTLANDVVTLQWSSIGTVRENEAYQVTIEDVTSPQTPRRTEYVTDTKFIVPSSFRPNDNMAHVIRWWVTTVRQNGVDEQGQPIYESAGAVSEKRVFTWVGVAVEGSPTPKP